MALRIGIVGTGAMAEYHAKRLSGIPGVTIAAVCDHIASRAVAFADAHGIAARFSDHDRMLASGEVDAVSIASYDGAHAASAIAALERNLPVFCEKPMARRLADAESMAEAARASAGRGKGAPAIVNFSKRNGGLLSLAARLAAERRVGRLVSLDLGYLQSWLLQDAWGDWRTNPRWKWRLAESQSTYGALGDLGSHLFDAALVLAGAGAGKDEGARLSVRACSALRFVPAREGDLEGPPAFESFEARLSLGSIDVSIRAGWRAPGHIDDFTATLRCEGGRIEVDPGRSRKSVRVTEASGKTTEVEVGPFPSTYEAFARVAQTRSSPDPDLDPDFERGLAVQRTIADCALLAGADPE